ncbi:transglutaminase-like domain-containing protein [Sphingobacterium corticis]|uniref:Transglutaminase-like domain-containing protein n=1 Tax=Sphingobacterium corticis TaxID=1812823 RepID=A0ABW5NMY1_9SPHI
MKIRWRVVGISFLSLLCVTFIFLCWMSPRLGGLLEFGKDHIDLTIQKLQFTTQKQANIKLYYGDLSKSPTSVKLRSAFPLDSIAAQCQTDFEKVKAVQSWVQSRWKHDGQNVPEYQDAYYILKEAEKGRRFRCVEYATVAQQCLQALGFSTRQLGLMTRDISEVKWNGGHVTNEVYIEDLKKWIFIDPQYDVITLRNGVPMNAVELQHCIANRIDFEILNPNKLITKTDYEKWIGPYLYYFTISLQRGQVSIWDRIVGNKRQLTLYPVGAEQPAYFQKMMRLNTALYTHSLDTFYPQF